MFALLGIAYGAGLVLVIVRAVRLHRYMKGQPGREQAFLLRHGVEN